jgi:hypothetical protein
MSSETITRPVWINGMRYNSAKVASVRMSLLLGWDVSSLWVGNIIKNNLTITFDGVTISAKPPESGLDNLGETEPPKPPPKRGRPKTARTETDRDEPDPPFPELSGMKLKWLEETPIQNQIPSESEDAGVSRGSPRLPLLRYSRGQSPLERGICPVRN